MFLKDGKPCCGSGCSAADSSGSRARMMARWGWGGPGWMGGDTGHTGGDTPFSHLLIGGSDLEKGQDGRLFSLMPSLGL